MTLRIGSLCSGYGGLDLAVESVLDARTAWFVEYDKDPSRILAHHWPDVPNHGDVKHTDWSQVEPVDILTAGYPCQPFSHAGKRKGSDDPRHLWPDVARAIGALRPRLVVLENVRGHVSLGLADVLADLSGLGYGARWGVVRAADAGAPHGRARVFIVATPDAAHLGHERGGRARDGRPGPTDSRDAAPDPRGQRHGRGVHPADVGRVDGPDAGEARERSREVAVDRGAAVVADATRIGRGEGWAESAGRLGGSTAVVGGVAVADADPEGPQGGESAQGRDVPAWSATPDAYRDGLEGFGRLESIGCDTDGRRRADIAWGDYEPAVRRWERVLGRPAPRPTEPGRNGERLSPRFVEFMMGLPEGHVTDVPGLSRNAQLKSLGNGVVPQQCALALRLLGVAA